MKRSSGFALISVLIGLAILSLLAEMILSATLISSSDAQQQLDEVRTTAIAEGAIAVTELALTDRLLDRRPRVDGVSSIIHMDGAQVAIAVQDEYGKIDLNHADGSLLTSLFRFAGLGTADTDALSGGFGLERSRARSAPSRRHR